MQQILNSYVARPRFNLVLLGTFAAVALLLAAVGIYGVIAYSVTQRRHEIGVRMAMGAQPADVLRQVVGHGMLPVLIGIAMGVAASLAATRLLTSFLFSIRPNDTATFAGVTLVVVLIAFLASYLPARRATRVDPLVALRYE
jgi:putative ABC transport system permease protein